MTAASRPRQVVERLLAGIAEGPSPELAEPYAEDALVELPFAKPGGLRLQGRAEIRQHFIRASGGPLRLVPEKVVLHETADPEVVVAEYDYRGEVTTTGHSFVVSNIQVVRVKDGLITSSRDFHDHAGLAAAMGVRRLPN